MVLPDRCKLQVDVARDHGISCSCDGMVIAIDMHRDSSGGSKSVTADLTRCKKKRTGPEPSSSTPPLQCVEGGPRMVLGTTSIMAAHGSWNENQTRPHRGVTPCRRQRQARHCLPSTFFSADVFATFDELDTGFIVPCKNTDLFVRAVDEFAAVRRPAVSEMYITNADGISVKYTMIITERQITIRKSPRVRRPAPEGKVHRVCHHPCLQADTDLYSKTVGHRDSATA